ncbi:carboxymuconolactone decarboxylase family protein [Parvibaculum sp.]|uniref:carboxymuconolactone decarboxylase family protein n=1 Tax=Parvibaculum sp. TaxID=2024848 RepID=UPI00320E348B
MTTSGFGRLNYPAASPGAYRAMLQVSEYVKGRLGNELVELVSLRASQINGCAFCIDMHTQELRAAGMEERKLYLLSVWREVALYSPRERVALAWTEALTRLTNEGVSDALYEEARSVLGDAELVDLALAVNAINGWNRLSIAFHAAAGHYKAGSLAAKSA